MYDLGFRVWGSGLRIQGSGFRVKGEGFRALPDDGLTPRARGGVLRFEAQRCVQAAGRHPRRNLGSRGLGVRV
jgi:hypothetical protein